MEIFILPLFMIFFNIDILEHLGPLLMVIFLGTLGFCALGTLLSSLSSNLKTREIMLPILLYPLLIPIVIGVVRMTGQLLEGVPLLDMMKWVGLTASFDIGGVIRWIILVSCLLQTRLFGGVSFIMFILLSSVIESLKKTWIY